jgi:very-short-patch-repair endonuclease
VLQGTGDTNARSKLLRREMSLPEVALWSALRQRPSALKFRRQHPSGPYTADFYRHAARLIVEVDGEAHGRGDRPLRDAARDRWFEERGIAVLRVPAMEVLRNCDGVLTGIAALAVERIDAQE